MTTDRLLLVEGPGDKEVIEEIIQKIPGRKREIAVMILGGDIMAKQDLAPLKSQFEVRALIDREAAASTRKIRNEFRRQCEALGITCHQLERYAVENYISIESFKRVYPHQGICLTSILPLKKIESQLGFNPKGCLRQLFRETSLEHLIQTDLYKFVSELVTI